LVARKKEGDKERETKKERLNIEKEGERERIFFFL